eukprot:m.977134 g.977134  ORF g.977134 m.977134 type:complete len:96 (+) comp23950_c1_seq2:245-532(+)
MKSWMQGKTFRVECFCSAEDFPFPPKVSIGNKDPKTVEQRRINLQGYIQRVFNMMTRNATSKLARSPSKANLLATLPFFSEDTINMGTIDMQACE